MSAVPTNNTVTTSPDETIHSSSSSTHHQPAQNTVLPTLLDDSFSDVLMDFDFESLNPGVDALHAPPAQVPDQPVNGGPQSHIPPENPPAATFRTFPQPTIPPAILPDIPNPLTFSTFDGAYLPYPFAYPNRAPVPFLASPSAATFHPGYRASLSNATDFSIPMAALAPSWSVTGMNPEPERAPVSGQWMGVPMGMPPVARGNANPASTVTAGGSGAGASGTPAVARAGGAWAPVSHCSCCHRVNPLVRVDDTIEWVRPGVMKMVVWFNWISNAGAEAQESWGP